MNHYRPFIIVASISAYAVTPPLHAQENASSGETNTSTLEDIVVTARKKEERLQDAPVAVTAVSSLTIERTGLNQISRLGEMVPNVSIQNLAGSTGATIYIRGIGDFESNLLAEPGVGLYIDGVYSGRQTGNGFDLVDIERIEVLRGPQGTLFGRNTTGGAVQIVSKAPSEDFGVIVKGSYGMGENGYDEMSAKATLNTGRFGPFAATIAYRHRQNDGLVDDLLQAKDSKDPGALRSDSVWTRINGDFGALTMDLSADWSHTHSRSAFNQITAVSPNFRNYFSNSPSFGGDPLQISTTRLDDIKILPVLGVDNENFTRTFGVSLTGGLELSDHFSLKSISAYRRYRDRLFGTLQTTGATRGVVRNPDGTTMIADFAGGFGGEQQLRHRQYSQEFQLLGKGDNWDAVAGLFWFQEKGREVFRQQIGSIQPGAGPGGLVGVVLRPVQSYSGTIESKAAFGQFSYRPSALGDKFELTGGIRYTHDKKNVTTVGGRQGEDSWSNLSWLASASYKITPDVMGYARVSTGFRAGGIGVRSLNFNPFDPEKVITYEAGLKSELFDRRLRANLAAFYSNYTDLQIVLQNTGPAGTSNDTVNAGKARYQGVEAELTAMPVDGLTLSGTLGYTDPRYKQFLYRPAGGAIIDIKDEALFAKMAKWNVFASADYQFPPTSIGVFSARASYSYLGTRYPYPNPRVNIFVEQIKSPPQHNVDAYLTLSEIPLPSTGHLEISLWCKNITNEDKRVNAIDFTGLGYATVSYGLKRSFGIDVTAGF